MRCTEECTKESNVAIACAPQLWPQAAQVTNGQLVEGVIVSVQPFGALIKLPNGLQGMLHARGFSAKRVNNLRRCLNAGETIKVCRLSYSRVHVQHVWFERS